MANAVPIDLTDTVIPEQTTQKITFVVKDEDGVAIPGASLATLTVTLYNENDEAIINGRDGTDILGVNGGQVDVSGNGEWVMAPADNAIVGAFGSENHIVLVEWTYGTKQGRQPIRILVCDLAHVP